MHALKTLLTEMREPLLLPEILDSLTKLGKYSFTFRNRFVYVLFPFYDPAHNESFNACYRFVERSFRKTLRILLFDAYCMSF